MNMNTYKFVQGNHGNQMYSAFAELWKDRKYCDCTLVVENFRIQLHKLVILAVWPSVMTSFSITEENGNVEIYLPEFICPNALVDFVSYLYDGEIAVTRKNCNTLETIASEMSNDTLSQVCQNYRESCLGEKMQPEPVRSKNLCTIITKLSERHVHNINLLNRMKSSNSSQFSMCKRKADAFNCKPSCKCQKTSPNEICNKMDEDTSRDSEDTNKSSRSSGEVSPQSVIKQESVTDEDDSDYYLDSKKNSRFPCQRNDSSTDSTRRKSVNSRFAENSQEDSLWFSNGILKFDDSVSNSVGADKSPKVNKRIGKKYRNYTQEMLAMAFSDTKSGKHSVLRAAKIYGVPEETLRDKIKGRRKLDCTQGRSHCFSEEEEYKILDTLEFYGKSGYKYKGIDIIRIATRFAVDYRKRIRPGDEAAEPDTGNIPRSQRGQKLYNRSIRGLKLTRKWFDGFYQRWFERLDPYIVVPNRPGKVPENPVLSEDILSDFFRKYEQLLVEFNLTDKPGNIYFVEDVRLLNLVVGPRDEKLQKSVTVAAVMNLAGFAFSPYFVKEAIDSDAENYFQELNGPVNETENQTLQDYLLKCMAVLDETETRLLIINGDKLFVFIGIEEWAARNNIVLLIIPENVALYLRPFDFSVEGSFQKLVDQGYEISRDLSASENYQLFKTHVELQFSSTFTEERLTGAVNKIGLFPPDFNIAKTLCLENAMHVKKRNIRSGSRYKQYSQACVNSGCDAVLYGGLSVLRASKIYGVPENTLRDFVKERRAKMLEQSTDTGITWETGHNA